MILTAIVRSIDGVRRDVYQGGGRLRRPTTRLHTRNLSGDTRAPPLGVLKVVVSNRIQAKDVCGVILSSTHVYGILNTYMGYAKLVSNFNPQRCGYIADATFPCRSGFGKVDKSSGCLSGTTCRDMGGGMSVCMFRTFCRERGHPRQLRSSRSHTRIGRSWRRQCCDGKC